MVVKTHSVFDGVLNRGLIMALIVAMACTNLHAQRSPFDPALSDEAARIQEEVNCFTDRSFYITKELIFFRARIETEGLPDEWQTEVGPDNPRAWSTVLYVELVSPEGRQMARGKYEVRKGISTGMIRIPEHLLSGHYYLRCYTRWMRNRGPETYCYVPLRIVNPKRPELNGEIQQAEAGAELAVRNVERAEISFEMHPSEFGRGDSIRLDLNFQDSISGCLAVVPQIAGPEDQLFELHSSGQDSSAEFSLNFLPDKFGPSLSGSVIFPDAVDEVLPPARIHFTLMGDMPGYFVCRSDAFGRFTVGLPVRTGKLDLFVHPESPHGRSVEVRIDQDFDPRQFRLPAPAFSLSELEAMQATIMARNTQLSGIYQEVDTRTDESAGDQAVPFYGTPTHSVDMDRYVLLPTLKEVFLNLVPGVTPVTRRNRTVLQISSKNPSLFLYESLVMVDQVPVLDMEKFMALSPAKIKRIDVVEDVYVKGDLRFSGIINLQSREMDMAGIDLPDNSFFIDYLAMNPPVPVQDPVSEDDRMPDTRNTMLWLADFKLKNGNPSHVSFAAPDYPGEYLVIFRGLDANGKLIMAETIFKVR